MNVKYKFVANNLVVVISGELDENTTCFARTTIDKLIEEKSPNSVIFDLSEVTFLDSIGVGLFLGRYKKIQKYGGSMYFGATSDASERVLKISGLYQLIPSYSA